MEFPLLVFLSNLHSDSRRQIAGLNGISTFSFLRTSVLISTVVVSVYATTNKEEGFLYSHSLASICYWVIHQVEWLASEGSDSAHYENTGVLWAPVRSPWYKAQPDQSSIMGCFGPKLQVGKMIKEDKKQCRHRKQLLNKNYISAKSKSITDKISFSGILKKCVALNLSSKWSYNLNLAPI